MFQQVTIVYRESGKIKEKHLCRFYKKSVQLKSLGGVGGDVCLMITISHGGALGTPNSDYEIYVPEYFGHGFAKKVKMDEGNTEVVVVIKAISIGLRLAPARAPCHQPRPP